MNWDSENSDLQNLLDVTLSAKNRLKSLLPPANYLDKLFEEIRAEFSKFLDAAQQIVVEKLYILIEHDYQKHGLVGKGYHCLEHSLELTNLILKSWLDPNSALPRLTPAELLETSVAALLHDYDPHSNGGVPRVERTLHGLKTDELLKDFLERLKLKLNHIALLIERSDYPFVPAKEIPWKANLLLNFPIDQERMRFEFRAEKLAQFDKASTYFMLTPAAAAERVRGLAEELGLPAEKLLLETYEFLRKENIFLVAGWAPEKYRQRWNLVEKHFKDFARMKGKMVS